MPAVYHFPVDLESGSCNLARTRSGSEGKLGLERVAGVDSREAGERVCLAARGHVKHDMARLVDHAPRDVRQISATCGRLGTVQRHVSGCLSSSSIARFCFPADMQQYK